MKQSLMDHNPFGSIGTCTKSGWINEETLEFWFDHFLNCLAEEFPAANTACIRWQQQSYAESECRIEST